MSWPVQQNRSDRYFRKSRARRPCATIDENAVMTASPQQPIEPPAPPRRPQRRRRWVVGGGVVLAAGLVAGAVVAGVAGARTSSPSPSPSAERERHGPMFGHEKGLH